MRYGGGKKKERRIIYGMDGVDTSNSKKVTAGSALFAWCRFVECFLPGLPKSTPPPPLPTSGPLFVGVSRGAGCTGDKDYLFGWLIFICVL